MTFQNNKKTFLEKLDKSKKGEIDQRIIPLLQSINQKNEYYTTSSCSGRVYLWRGSGKKNETEWLRVSHDFIDENFFQIPKNMITKKGLIWLRLEPLILHIACRNLDAANKLLTTARKLYKKSCLLSVSSKIVVEIRGSEFLEMPLYIDKKLLFNDLDELLGLVNQKLERIFRSVNKLEKELSSKT